ncbi:hypothetical protein [Pantoea sp.]|uniref:hypothetical protein n=1 Tax=Pantoea sp. TaxID=69393 RepID=UPI0028B16A62|nr:hypothetical protein [Pantoea sp.]
MTLEQRVADLEKAVANLTLSNDKAEELSKMMRDVAAEAIKNACRPGGRLHQRGEKAAKSNLTAFEIEPGSVNISPARISASELV